MAGFGKSEERQGKIAAMQKLVDEGLASGIGRKSRDENFEAARARVEARRVGE